MPVGDDKEPDSLVTPVKDGLKTHEGRTKDAPQIVLFPPPAPEENLTSKGLYRVYYEEF